jgi:hypothetical protein
MVTKIKLVILLLAVIGSLIIVAMPRVSAQKTTDRDEKDERSEDNAEVKRGFEIAPVPLNLHRKNRELVSLGSYIVNAQGACNDCHTWPSYKEGGNPYLGQPEQINAEHYLAGGRPFGPGVVSRNITPSLTTGRPADLTFDEFLQVMHTGHDPDNPGYIFQVMPWPIYGKMTEHDLRAVYEYLSAIPHAEPQ